MYIDTCMHTYIHTYVHTYKWTWKGGLVVKKSCYSSREPGFDSQHLHGGSQPSVAPVPGDIMTSSDL